MTTLNVNGETRQVEVPDDMPLLWVLRDVLGMTGRKFGCGVALCGACTIHLDGQRVRSCITPVAAAADKGITTIEAIGRTAAGGRIQRAWAELDVPQCEITLKDGRVEQTNFADYRVLRINESPPIEVHILESGEGPGGIGEPGTSCVMPALTNAIYAATGTRVQELPLANQLARS